MQDDIHTITVESPYGTLCLSASADGIVALDWHDAEQENETPLLSEGAKQLAAYFAGDLQKFDLPLKPSGNSFQQSVCQAMLDIPYGETTTYGAIADKLGTYGQPVGAACGGNTIPIIIPCHRVLAADGVGGYSGEGGVERKIALLKHENAFPYLL